MALRVMRGEAGGRRLVAPKGDARPTADRVKESLFASLGADRLEGATVLDLYAGSGALGIEALSRGAAHAVFVDKDRRRQDALRTNLAATGFTERAQLHAGLAASFVGRGRRAMWHSISCSSTRRTTWTRPTWRGPGRPGAPGPARRRRNRGDRDPP